MYRYSSTILDDRSALDSAYANAVWHFARGMAFVAKSDLLHADAELRALRKITAEPKIAEMSIWDMNTMRQILDIAIYMLGGEIAAAQGETELAVKYLSKAVALEDGLQYNEPSDWVFSVRQALGAVLMSANRFSEAETVYHADLLKNPEIGWSLFGLAASLDAQQKTSEANQVRSRFDKAWSDADITLKESRILN